MGLFDTIQGGIQKYQSYLPEFVTQDYKIMPDLFPGASSADRQGPYPTPGEGYNFLRDATAINPSIDVPLSVLGGLGGRLLQGIKASRMAPRAFQGAQKGAIGGGAAALSDDAMRMAQPDVPFRGSPLEGFGDNAAGSVRGNVEMGTPRLGDDFRAMDELGPLDGPDPNSRWFEHEDMINGADPDWYARPTEYLPDEFSDALKPGSGYNPMEGGTITGDERFDNMVLEAMQQYIAMGADERTALEAAILQFSDKFGL